MEAVPQAKQLQSNLQAKPKVKIDIVNKNYREYK
jgi:hypothetical protein